MARKKYTETKADIIDPIENVVADEAKEVIEEMGEAPYEDAQPISTYKTADCVVTEKYGNVIVFAINGTNCQGVLDNAKRGDTVKVTYCEEDGKTFITGIKER